MIRRRALRLSFSDRAPRIKSANLSTPTTIGAAWVPNFLLRQRRPDRLQLVRLDDVALLEVVEVLQADAALEALVDFLHVVLETAQGGDAAASMTSLSVTFPTPEWMTSTVTLGVASLVSAFFSASTDPCTSALTMILRTFAWSFLPLASRSSSESFLVPAMRSFSRVLVRRCSAMVAAAFSSSTMLNS